MNHHLNEKSIEKVTLEWFENLGFHVASGPSISPDDPGAERSDYGQVVLEGRLRTALETINPDIPAQAIDDTIREITRTHSPSPVENNRHFHRMLTEGVDVSFYGRRRRNPRYPMAH